MTKKEKLIADAQKLLQKGQVDKAIKGYQDAVALEPADQRVRQRLAELLTRVNRFDEARTEFIAVGKALASSGFYLKAIAVYKQIEKLFPDDIATILILASLNEKHGLIAQAMAEYKRAFEYYEQQPNMAEAVKVLDLMQKADPQNVNLRLKLAEVLHQLGRRDESYETFCALAGLVVERRDEASFQRLIARVSELFPEKNEVARSVLLRQIEEGNADQAVQLLHSLLRADPRLLWVWQLLVTAYDRLGDLGKLKATSQHFIKFFPAELSPREHLVRCLLADQDAEEMLAQLEVAEQVFLAAGAAATLKQLYLEIEKLIPIDVRVLKGLIRACRACGEDDLAAQYTAKIASLASLSRTEAPIMPQEQQSIAELPEQAELAPEPVPQLQIEPVSPDMPALHEPAEIAQVLYEIEIELDLDEEPVADTPAVASHTENWFDTVSDVFDTITTTTGTVKYGDGLESGDSQSHFDLGSAFREMGLLDEAINEFRLASEDPARRVECLIQQGCCLRDKGDFVHAESALQSLLAVPGLSLEESSAIKYELALTCEADGRAADAARLFGEIEATNAAFRDVKLRLQQSSDGTEGFDFDEDELLDFELK